MNCEHFEENVVALTRSETIDAALAERARRHGEACPLCAARLETENELSVGLRALAASDRAAESPSRVEAMLLAAFRERNPRTAKVAPKPWAGVLSLLGSRNARLGIGWVLAAAVVVILLVAAVSAVRSRRPVPAQQEAHQSTTPAPDQTDIAPQNTPSTPKTGSKKNEDPRDRRLILWQRRTRSINASLNRNQSEPGSGNGERQIATDFIPMMGDYNFPAPDSGQVVRVELPRTALIRFGLPMNVERAGARIKADVVVGNDGLARAIRFVH
ncbi:MAG TPA: hypothetical protein VJH03_10590 [Blastocatellia bacterium]|nr:hypothetical protein [Blastocatellia bacterium]